MKKTYWSLVFLLSINFGLNTTKAHAQNLDHLYYCNENTDIAQLFIINPYYSVGHIIDNDNYLVLFNHENLPLDTLNLGDSKNYFLQNLIVTGTNKFFISALKYYKVIEIKAGKFHFLEEKELREGKNNLPDYANLEGMIYGQYMKIDDLIFLERPEGNRRRDIGYSLYLFKGGKQITLVENQKSEIKEKYSGIGLYSKVMHLGEHLLISVEKANKMILFDLATNDIKEIDFPEVDKRNESWNCFYDYRAKKAYAVKFYKKQEHEIYALDLEKESFSFLEKTEHKPITFVDGKYHYTSKEKDEITNKEMICHYLKPIGK
ncbi:MAG: hypothetical protein ACQETL_01870 [Bacteroidota bacterium]